MSLNVEMKAPYMAKLVCAYTGKPAKVRMVSVGDCPPIYFASAAYDPSAYVQTAAELLKALGTRNGVDGAARNGAELVCPYTGVRMSIEKVEGLGFHAVGGFNPAAACTDPQKFAAAMLMRGGVPAKNAPAALRVSASREDGPPETMDGPRVSEDASLGFAEELLKGSHVPSATVSVPSGVPRKRGKGK